MSRVNDERGLAGREAVEDFFDEPSEFTNLLLPLVKALEWPGTYRNLVEALPHFSETLDLTGFRNVMARLRYKSEPLDISLTEIDKRLLPVIFVPEESEALLVLEKNGEEYLVINSLTGLRQRIRPQDTPGTVYVFKPIDDKFAPKVKKTGWFMTHYARFSSLIKQVMTLSYVLNIFILISPIYIMNVYDKIIDTRSVAMLASLAVGVVGILVAADLLGGIRAKILSHVAARLDKSVSTAIIERLMYLPPSYTENATVGAQIARLRDFELIRDFFTSPLATMVFELPFLVIFMLVIFSLTGWLVFIPITMLALYGVVYHNVNPTLQKYIAKSSEIGIRKQSFQLEALSNLREIKTTASEDIWTERFNEINAESTKNGFQASMITNGLNALSETFMMSSGLMVLGFGAVSVLNGNATVGALIATMMLTWRILAPMKMLFSILPRMRQIVQNIKKIDALMELPLERNLDKLITPIQKGRGRLEFTRVSFRYRPDTPPAVLGVTFKIEPRQIVCVAGRNGSGKSTLLKLIPGLYQPQAGLIELDGANIQQLDRIEMRHAIAYMPQNTRMFFGTIEQNLLFGHPIASKEEMVRATKLAGVYEEIIRLPKGFQTHLRDQSSSFLSSSFSQRIALARTYIRSSPIMLFDEPSNTLDEQGDKDFMNAIKHLAKRSTIILVTHRPGHLKIADRILYMSQGELVLNGPPGEVLEKIPFDYL